jgi:hypothetical protein
MALATNTNTYIIFVFVSLILVGVIGLGCKLGRRRRETPIPPYLYLPTRPAEELSCPHSSTSSSLPSETSSSKAKDKAPLERGKGWKREAIQSTDKTMSAEAQQGYRDLLGDVHRVFDENKVKYSLAAGTLLGSYRHGDIIPYDDDADIVVRYTDREKVYSLKDEFKKEGISLEGGCLACWSNYYKEICEFINTTGESGGFPDKTRMSKPCESTPYFGILKRGDLHVDLFLVIPLSNLQNSKETFYTVYGNNRLITQEQYDQMFDTVPCDFGDVTLSCPSNTHELLCHQYGDLSLPSFSQQENKSSNPAMFRGADATTPHIVKGKGGYELRV